MLAVATVDEAIQLRQNNITASILVMVQPHEDASPLVIEHNLRLMLSETDGGAALGELARRANKVVPVHCKVDTGMGRAGITMDAVVKTLRYLTRISHIDIEGVATHFPVADVMRDPFTGEQIRQFRHLLGDLDKEGIPYEMTHAANSAAIVNFPSSAFDMVRPGLMTYGIWPTDTPPHTSPLRPVLRWETRIVLIKEMPPETPIGYGRTYITPYRMRVAVLPVGYADGYAFSLSNRAEVLIRGRRCPVRGRVSMDQIVVDVTDVPGVSIGDTATLIGRDGDATITIEEMAAWAQTIPYEVLTRIGARVARIYVE
jgi:alanine racemase